MNRHGIRKPLVDVVSPTAFDIDGHSTLCAIRLPLPMSAMIKHGEWHTLVFLARWGLPPCIRASFLDWESWAKDVTGSHEPAVPASPPTAAGLGECADFLRRHSSKLLAHDDEDHTLSFALEKTLQKLDGYRLGLSGACLEERDGHHIMHSAEKLWHAFVMCSHAQDRSRSLTSLVKQGLHICFPGVEETWVDTWEYDAQVSNKLRVLPGKSVLQRSSLLIDVAWMLLARKQYHTDNDRLLFGWADSSLQGGLDWLIVAYDVVHQSRLLEVVDAADKSSLCEEKP